MNDYITYCAKAKINNIIQKKGSIGILAKIESKSLFSFETINSSEDPKLMFMINFNLVKISNTPIILFDYLSFQKLVDKIIDFDYKSQEFVIRES